MKKASGPVRKAFRDNYLAAIALLVFLLSCFQGQAQIFQYPNQGTYGTGEHRRVIDSTLYFPTGCGTPSGVASLNSYGFTGSGQKIRQAAIYADTCGHKVYWFDWTDSTWQEFGTGTSGSGCLNCSADSLRHIKIDTAGMSDTTKYLYYDKVSNTFRFRKTNLADVLGALGYPPLAASDTAWLLSSRWYRQKGLDSLAVVLNAAIALKKNNNDSATNSSSYVTRGWLYHVMDSLNALVENTNYRSVGSSGIDLFNFSSAGNQTNLTFPKIRDTSAQHSQWVSPGDSALTIADHDSTSPNALQTKYRSDTMRTRIDTALDNKMRNFGGAPGQLQGTYAGIPAATGYPTGTTYIAQDSGFHYVDTGAGGSRGWKRIVGGSAGGGTIGGSVASGQVAYGSASNTIAGDAHFTNNSSTHTVFSDSIHTSSLLADASALTTNQFPHRLLTGYGGYSGLLLKNMSTSGAGATQLKITTASEKGGFLFNVLGDNWPGANATPVLRIFGNQPFVQAADSADFIWEQGTPGVSAQEWMHYFYNPAYQNASLLIGNVLPFPADYRNHGSTLFVYGSAKVMSGLTLNDAGQHYYVIRGGNFHDSVNYQGGVGAEIRGAIVSQPDNPLMRLDSVGRARLYFYNNSNPAQAISTKALLVDNSGNVKLGGVYDTAAGTQNGTAVLYWGPNGYPTSNDSKLSFNYNTNVLDVRSTAGGMLKADSAALYHGYLRLADYGGTYAYVAADNYQLRTSYVEGVNLRFRVVNSTNPRLDAFEIDSTGDIRWLVQPKTYTTGDSVLMIASNGIVHKMRISDLGAIIGTGGGFYQTVQSNAVSQTQRAKLNFNSHFTVTDNSGNGSTDVDLTTAADQSAKDSSSKIANTKYVDKAVAAALASSPVNVYDLGSGGSQQRANAVGDSLYIRTSYTNGRADDTLADGGINHVTGNLFSQTADGTVTNTASTTSILGTGTGSKTIPIKYLVAGQTIRVKGFGYISTDASVPTLTITLNNGSSTAGNGVGGLLTASMNNVPIEWEYWGTVRTTGSSGTIMMNGWISIGGVKAYLASSAASLFDNTSGKTFDVTAQWGTASTNNTIVTKQCDISVN